MSNTPFLFCNEITAARESVRSLDVLKPNIVVTEQGMPLIGDKVVEKITKLAKYFDRIAIPNNGRYVNRLGN